MIATFSRAPLNTSRLKAVYCHDLTKLTGPFYLDIDECAEGSHECSANAVCNNTKGSYNCTCNPGYYGDGRSCDPGIFSVFVLRRNLSGVFLFYVLCFSYTYG